MLAIAFSIEVMIRSAASFHPMCRSIISADKIIASMEAAIQAKIVTYDFARQMEGAKKVSCSGFGQAMVERM